MDILLAQLQGTSKQAVCFGSISFLILAKKWVFDWRQHFIMTTPWFTLKQFPLKTSDSYVASKNEGQDDHTFTEEVRIFSWGRQSTDISAMIMLLCEVWSQLRMQTDAKVYVSLLSHELPTWYLQTIISSTREKNET